MARPQHTSFLTYALLAVPFLFCPSLPAQQQTGSITGTISDIHKGVLPGARVVVEPGNLSDATNTQGVFTISGVNPGPTR